MEINHNMEKIDIEIFYKPNEKIKEKLKGIFSYNREVNKLRLFGKKFVERNKDKCKIVYGDKEHDLKQFFEEIENNYNHKDEVKIILRIHKNIPDVSLMFFRCIYLLSFTKIYENDEPNSLSSLYEHQEENKSNVNDINNNFDKLNKIQIDSSISSIKKRTTMKNF